MALRWFVSSTSSMQGLNPAAHSFGKASDRKTPLGELTDFTAVTDLDCLERSTETALSATLSTRMVASMFRNFCWRTEYPSLDCTPVSHPPSSASPIIPLASMGLAKQFIFTTERRESGQSRHGGDDQEKSPRILVCIILESIATKVTTRQQSVEAESHPQ
jgi:hypothetical protein